MKMDQIYIKS